MTGIAKLLGRPLGNVATLTEMETRQILSHYQIPMNAYKLVDSVEEAVQSAQDIGYPVVLKIVSPMIIHKSDIGGVKVNIDSEKALRKAYREIMDNALKHTARENIVGITVQEMSSGEAEILVGIKRDKIFGPTILLGFGGVLVELLKDYSLRICPVDREDVLEMLAELKAYRLLSGYRGKPETDIEALVSLVIKVSQMAMDLEELDELDLNPVFVKVKGQGVVAVDARLAVRQIE